MRKPITLRWRFACAATVAITTALCVSACNAGGAGGSAGGVLTLGGEAIGMTRVFNPYLETSALGLAGNSLVSGSAAGFINEPLVQVNYLKANTVIPWLAKSWAWSDGNKTLTWHLRTGVKWSDGKPFSSADVAFSYNLMKKFPALNTSGIKFSTAQAIDTNTVVVRFSEPQQQNFETLGSLIIVPQHIWSTIKDPTKYADPNPVGTGPYELSTFSAQGYLLKKNPHYWQPGKPQVSGLRFVAYSSNVTLAQAVVSGKVDWAGVYIANAQQSYLNRSSDNHYWTPTSGSGGLIPNMNKFPLNDRKVRQAISLGIDRKEISAARNALPASNQTGLPVPTFNNQIASQYKNLNFKKDTAAAKQLLESDGWKMGSNGYYAKNGRQLAFSVSFPSAYNSQAEIASVLGPELKKIGIKMTVDNVPAADINKLTGSGDFQSTIGYPVSYGPTAWSFYYAQMDPEFYQPVGKNEPTYQDIERFNDPTAKKLFQEYPTASAPRQQEIINQLEGIFIKNLPIITIYTWGDQGDWSTSKVTGFATPSNPYFTPSPNEVVALRLKYKK